MILTSLVAAKVAVQVVEYYKQALNALQGGEEGGLNEFLVSRIYLSWTKYLSFKVKNSIDTFFSLQDK